MLRFARPLSTNWLICADSLFPEYSEELMGETDPHLSQLPEFGSRQGDALISENLRDLFMAYEVSHINYRTSVMLQ